MRRPLMRVMAGLALGLGLLQGSGTAAAQAAPAPVAAADAEETLVLQATDGLRLSGTLLRPAAVDRPAVAVIIAGSGATDRDGNTVGVAGKNMSLRLLAQALAQAGIASLRYDKRGVSASLGGPIQEADLRFGQYADDAAAWVALLARDARFSKVIIIGHSEGSTLGMLAAQRGGVAAYVSLAGPGRDAGTVLRSQLQSHLSPELAAANDRILTDLQQGRTVTDVPVALVPLYRPSVQPYLMSWLAVDPAKEIAKLTMPVAVFQGDTDIQVGVEDARLLAAARPGAELHVIHGMNHVFKLVPAKRMAQLASYADPSLPLAPELARQLSEFLLAALPAP